MDIRYSLRMMRRAPGFTAVVILSLALGLGANTAIFSLIHSVMLRMLPVHQPEQLVELLSRYPGEPRTNGFSWKVYEHFRDHNHVFDALTGISPARFEVKRDDADVETVDGEYVVGNFFSALGVQAAIGRLIGPENDQLGDSDCATAVVSWSYWKSRFNLDPTILGKRIVVNGVPVTIIGVAPREFFGLRIEVRPSLWVPAALEAMIQQPSRRASGQLALGLVGRLKAGVSIEQARAEMSVLDRWRVDEIAGRSKDPLMRQLKIELEPAGSGLSRLRDQLTKPLLLLMAIVSLLLLLTCTNIAGMLLARGAARTHEIAVRVSLGAGRFRLARQALTESLILSFAGSLPGVLLAYAGAGALVRILESGRTAPGGPFHLDLQVAPDFSVLLFTGGIALLAGAIFGFAPFWNAFTSTPAQSMKGIGKGGETKLRKLFGKGLVAGQVALSIVLLSTAGLAISHLSNLRNLDLGFQSDSVLLVTLDPSRSGYQHEQLSFSYQDLLKRLEAIPGVDSATLSAVTPISGAAASRFARVEGYQEKAEDRRYLSLNWIAPKYFETLRIPLLAGRDFTFADQGSSRVAIISRSMARHYFGERNPIGKQITFDGDDQPYEIVGVAGDAKYAELRDAAPRTVYLAAFQMKSIPSQFALRTAPDAMAGAVRQIVHDVLKDVCVSKITTLSDQMDASIVPERLIAALSGSFGVLGALLAAIGLYGLLAYTVTRRTNEIGIRMALGATRGGVMRIVFHDAIGMVCAGLAIGIPMALWGKSLAASLVGNLQLKLAAPIIFGALTMIVVALFAAYLPARRAAAVDPMNALRHE